MNVRMRFDNPMLGGLRGRRFARSGGAGRMESRPFGAGGVLRMHSPAIIHAHRQTTWNRYLSAPVFRIGINRSSATPVQRGRDRIETRVLREPGPVRELLRVEPPPARLVSVNETATLTTRSLRELTEATIERVIRHRHRIERGRDTSVVMRERQNVTADVGRLLERTTARSPETTASLQSSPAHQSGTPPVPAMPDLDRLTDQIVSRIDDRLIAHQERMGTVF